MKEVKFEESWNKKRILIATLAVFTIGGAVYTFRGSIFPNFFSSNNKQEMPSKESVLSTKSEPSVQEALGKQIESIKKEINTINIDEIASSSPQIQKIINDVKSLEKLPQSQLKNACLNICGGL